MKKAIIFFTRIPIPGSTKTRLEPFLGKNTTCELHKAFIMDMYCEMQKVDVDIIVSHTINGDIAILQELIPNATAYIPQLDSNEFGLGEKMHHAIETVLKQYGYDCCLLIGSDVPLVTANDIMVAFKLLEANDMVLAPTVDGGYYMIGMKKACKAVFEIEYGVSTVMERTLQKIEKSGQTCGIANKLFDIDTIEDVLKLAGILYKDTTYPCRKTREFFDGIEYQLLGQGEYNINYLIDFAGKIINNQKKMADYMDENKQRLVVRLTTGSQMQLDNQIRYEYEALQLLYSSGRTPKAIYVDDTKSVIPQGFLVMEFLPGRPLNYDTDLTIAAKCLADIHNLPINETMFTNNEQPLIKPKNPLQAILDECWQMASVYLNSQYAISETSSLIRELLEHGRHLIENVSDFGERCIINTELNSGNFLINDRENDNSNNNIIDDSEYSNNYVIDWEKPLFAYAEQDLGHFLAPTTTFWKTDTILSKAQIEHFLYEYCKHSNKYSNSNYPRCSASNSKYAGEIDTVMVDFAWQNVLPYFTITCLRGITWCAMAYVEYQDPNRPIKNEFTYQKIKTYLSTKFLEMIKSDYM